MAETEALMTVDDVAALLKVSKQWVYRKGGLPSLKVGHFLRFNRDDVLAWLERGWRVMSRHTGGFDWTTLSLFFPAFAAGVAFGTLAFFGALLGVGLHP